MKESDQDHVAIVEKALKPCTRSLLIHVQVHSTLANNIKENQDNDSHLRTIQKMLKQAKKFISGNNNLIKCRLIFQIKNLIS